MVELFSGYEAHQPNPRATAPFVACCVIYRASTRPANIPAAETIITSAVVVVSGRTQLVQPQQANLVARIRSYCPPHFVIPTQEHRFGFQGIQSMYLHVRCVSRDVQVHVAEVQP